MRIHYKDISEFMEVDDAAFIELIEINAIDKAGFWMLDEPNWILLAIGLNQEPGRFEITLELDDRRLH